MFLNAEIFLLFFVRHFLGKFFVFEIVFNSLWTHFFFFYVFLALQNPSSNIAVIKFRTFDSTVNFTVTREFWLNDNVFVRLHAYSSIRLEIATVEIRRLRHPKAFFLSRYIVARWRHVLSRSSQVSGKICATNRYTNGWKKKYTNRYEELRKYITSQHTTQTFWILTALLHKNGMCEIFSIRNFRFEIFALRSGHSQMVRLQTTTFVSVV